MKLGDSMDILFMILESMSYAISDYTYSKNEAKIKSIIYNENDTENKLFILQVIILSHIAYNDDQLISSEEKEMIQKYIDINKPLFTKHLDTIKIVLSKSVWNYEDILNYIKYNKIELLLVKEIIKTLQNDYFKEERYQVVFSQLKEKLKIKEYSLRRMLSI